MDRMNGVERTFISIAAVGFALFLARVAALALL